MNSVWKIWNKITRSASIIGALITALIMLVVIIDVIGRLLFHSPMTGTPEIVANSVVGIVFLQLAWSVKEERHIRATFLLDQFPKLRVSMDIFANILGIVLFLAIIISCWPIAMHSIQVREFEGSAGVFRFPVYLIRVLLLIGSALTIGQHLEKLYYLFQGLRKTKSEAGVEQ